MLAQRRILSFIDLFVAQGLWCCSWPPARRVSTTGQTHLWWSAGVTLALKVFLLPWILHRLVRKLNVSGTSRR